MESKETKTVYILGAGASCSAALPMQRSLICEIFSFRSDSIKSFIPKKGFFGDENDDVDVDKDSIINGFSRFEESRFKVAEFIINCFLPSLEKAKLSFELEAIYSLSENYDAVGSPVLKEHKIKLYDILKDTNIELEDMFTLFDSIDAENDYYKDYTCQEISEIQGSFKYCIEYVLAYKEVIAVDTVDYDAFADMLINKRIGGGKNTHSVSVITMNWDDLLDRSLSRKCNSHNLTVKADERIYSDYCVYDYGLNGEFIPSTHIKPNGMYNLKYLKLHGSLNWLICPRCKRLFIDRDHSIAIRDEVCRFCNTEYSVKPPHLGGIIITPTFMKTLSELHLKSIWQNAFLELSKATEIVFIGYSFPDADFEMRCLLKKAVNPDTSITVVLHESDDMEGLIGQLKEKGIEESVLVNLRKRLDSPEKRYKSFFGKERVSVLYNGFDGYLGRK